MGIPWIREGQPIAETLAKLLRKDFDELAETDSFYDDEIYIKGLAENPTYWDRVAQPLSYRTDSCASIFIIDNGNGKLDREDLLLHSDGFYQEPVERCGFLDLFCSSSFESAFRYARLGVARFQNKSGYEYEATRDSRFPANVVPIVEELRRSYGDPFSVMPGTSVSLVKSALEAGCNIVNR